MLKDIPGVSLIMGDALNSNLLGNHSGGSSQSVTDIYHRTTCNSLRGSLFTQQTQTRSGFHSQVFYRETERRRTSFQAEDLNSFLLTSVASIGN